MDLVKSINEIKKLIKLDKLKEAFSVFNSVLHEYNLENDESILLTSRWEAWEREDRQAVNSVDVMDIRKNRIKLGMLKLVNSLNDIEINNVQDYIDVEEEKQELDEKATLVLNYILSQLIKEEEKQIAYSEFTQEKIKDWVIFKPPIEEIQNNFNKDLYNFLNNGVDLTYLSLRNLLIKSLQNVLGKEYIHKKRNESNFEKAILEIVIEQDEDEILVEDVIGRFVEVSFTNLGFDFKDRVLTYFTDFGEKFANGQLSNKINLKANVDKFGAFINNYNMTFGTSDTIKVNLIFERIIKREDIKNLLNSPVKKIVKKLNDKRKADFTDLEIKMLKNILDSQNKIPIKNISYSLVGSFLLLFLYHYLLNNNHPTQSNLGKQLKKIQIQIDKLDNQEKTTNTELNKLKGQFEKLVIDVQDFDAQNKQIINGFNNLKNEIIEIKSK